MAEVTRELADFDPSSGHLHTCPAESIQGADLIVECAEGCAGLLYGIAQDAERALAKELDRQIDRLHGPGAAAALDAAIADGSIYGDPG